MWQLFLLFLSGITLISFAVENHQPQWNDTFDFTHAEQQMKQASIVQMTNMRTYLEQQGKTARFVNEVHLAALSNGWLTAFKPIKDDDLGDAIAEVSAYAASEKLGLHLVPPTVLKEYEGRIGSAQFFVHSPFDLLKPEENKTAFAMIPVERKAAMYLFYYIFGQWDTHAENSIIAYDQTSNKAYLALIDNTAIRNRLKVRYGEHAFVKRMHQDDIKPYTGEPFPYDKPVILDLPITANKASEKLDDFPIPQYLLNNWVSYGMNKQACVVWSDALWVQFYRNSKEVPPNYTDFYPKEVMKQFKTLDLNMLHEIYNLGIQNKLDFCNDRYFADILARRDEVMNAYKHSKKRLN